MLTVPPVMGLLCLIYLIAALRTNIVFVVIFATLVPAFGLLAGAYWQLAQGNAEMGGKLVIVSDPKPPLYTCDEERTDMLSRLEVQSSGSLA